LTALFSGSTKAFEAVNGISPAVLAAGSAAYKVAYSQGTRTVFLTTIAFGIISIGLACILPNIDELTTANVATTLHKRGHEDEIIRSDAKLQKTVD
jgi:hypothetical protein